MIKTTLPHISRDPNTKALINVDLNSWEQYKANREKTLRIQLLEEEQAQLKADLEMIKNFILKGNS